MINHVHVLVTPTNVGAVSRMMQTLDRRYVRYLNDTLLRTGTFWEGRYKASMVDSERYILVCYRYIELNPVRAGMISDVADYCWSSYGCNGQGRPDPLIRSHPAYELIARGEGGRHAHYRD